MTVGRESRAAHVDEEGDLVFKLPLETISDGSEEEEKEDEEVGTSRGWWLAGEREEAREGVEASSTTHRSRRLNHHLLRE